MKFDFIISGVKQSEVQHLFDQTKEELSAKGINRLSVDEYPGFPCRVSLEDAKIGEEVLAFNYEHHQVNSPYRSSGAVFVRFNAIDARLKKNEIPKMLVHRYLSLRVYNDEGMMIDATTTNGERLKNIIQEIFENEEAKYIQVHNANPGCYNCQVNRVV